MSAGRSTACGRPRRAPRRAARRPVSMRSLALLRVLAGPAVLLHLQPFLSDLRSTGGSTAAPSTSPTRRGIPSCRRRSTSACSGSPPWRRSPCPRHPDARGDGDPFAIVTYNLFLSTTHFHNNRAYLVIVLERSTVAPDNERARAGRCGSCGSSARRCTRRSAPEQAARPGQFRHDRRRRARARADLEGHLPDWAVSLLTDRGFHTGAAEADRPHRAVHRGGALVAPHALRRGLGRGRLPSDDRGISLRSGLRLAIAVLVVWAVPSTRDRVLRIGPSAPRRRRLGALVRALDWPARFRVEPPPGSPVEVVDRDGTALRGAPAVALALSRLPLTAWFALPALLLPAVLRGR